MHEPVEPERRVIETNGRNDVVTFIEYEGNTVTAWIRMNNRETDPRLRNHV